MRELRVFLFVGLVAGLVAVAVAAPQRQEQRGRLGTMAPQESGRHDQSRLHDCQQACLQAREEAKQLQRYADRSRFEVETARQLGRQLRQQLEVMDGEHQRLPERLSAEERERQRKRLEKMSQCQRRWQGSLAALEEELQQRWPDPDELREQARSIERELKNYEKELRRLEELLGG